MTCNRKKSWSWSSQFMLLVCILLGLNISWSDASSGTGSHNTLSSKQKYGRVSEEEYVLTEEQIRDFHENGCCVLPDVLTEDEVLELERVFDKFLSREIEVPGKDFCDMSQPFDTPMEDWNIINCMLPTKYYPPMQNNIYERICSKIVQQLHPSFQMTKDYDQLLNKRPGRSKAIFAWHQDMGYWPGPKALNVDCTSTCTFSLAIDDSDEENGCLKYVAGSHLSRTLRPHVPYVGNSRDEGHALTIQVDETDEDVRLARAKRGWVTIHNEFVVHGSGGNNSPTRQRKTYVLAFRPKAVVDAERSIGFTHSHNDEVNWDTFQDDEPHRLKQQQSMD